MRNFPTDYSAILERLQAIDPGAYGRTRNYLAGSVTKLSPYITHGVISPLEVARIALAKASAKDCETLLRELAWREYFQDIWAVAGDGITTDLRYPQLLGKYSDTPEAILNAETGIQAIDSAITELYTTGYMHNHARMWTAMLATTLTRTKWWEPSRWLYYHLLDGDIASNTLSWQWVAGSLRKEPYLANQENINTFSRITQKDTFLDVSYEHLLEARLPKQFATRRNLQLTTHLPKTTVPMLQGEVLLYDMWSLNPMWHAENTVQRILLLEPEHFAQYPISEKRLSFILELAQNIPSLAVVCTSFTELAAMSPNARFTCVDHMTNHHWQATREQRERLTTTPKNMDATWSFMKFWSRTTLNLTEDEAKGNENL